MSESYTVRQQLQSYVETGREALRRKSQMASSSHLYSYTKAPVKA